jgi:phosphoribosylaminoimidazole-succinocarboxamide synthase
MTTTSSVITSLDLPNLKLFKEGKVRSVYEVGNDLLIVASDRVSAFDFILPNGIPHKGEVLTSVSQFWFDFLGDDIAHHLISTNVDDFPEECQQYSDILRGRSMLVKRTELIPVECVVRGYIIGSGWKDYQETGAICGIELPKGLQLADKLDTPIFTPAYKAEMGDHDENISKDQMDKLIGKDLADKLQAISLDIYTRGRDYAATKGIILADTKFEFGVIGNEIILIDEVLTPDSSRYWPAEDYKPGISPPSFDKQIVRDHLAATWDKNPPVPELPESIITRASERYIELKESLLG